MIIPFPTTLPDAMTLHHAAQQACAQHLHLVIDRDGEVKLTPFLRPGMHKIAVMEKPSACSAPAQRAEGVEA